MTMDSKRVAKNDMKMVMGRLIMGVGAGIQGAGTMMMFSVVIGLLTVVFSGYQAILKETDLSLFNWQLTITGYQAAIIWSWIVATVTLMLVVILRDVLNLGHKEFYLWGRFFSWKDFQKQALIRSFFSAVILYLLAVYGKGLWEAVPGIPLLRVFFIGLVVLVSGFGIRSLGYQKLFRPVWIMGASLPESLKD